MKKPLFWILIFGLILRLVSLNQSFWLDEATSGLVVRDMGFLTILQKFSPSDFHPPLYYLMLKVWSGTFGTGEIALRSLSVVLGGVSIYFGYLIGKKILNKKAGLIAAALLATSGLHVYYSQEARMYMFSTLLVSCLIYFFMKVLEKPSKKTWIIFSVLLAVNSLVDYLPNLVIPVFWIYALAQNKKKTWWKCFIASHLLLLLAWAFWFSVFTKQLANGFAVKTLVGNWWQVLGKTNLKELLLVPTKFIFGRISLINKNIYALLVAGIGLIYSCFLFFGRPSKKDRLGFIWLWLLFPVLSAAVLGLRVSVFSYFRLIFVLPAFFLLLAAGIGKLRGFWFKLALGFVLAVNILSSGAYLFNPRFQREDWRGLVSFIKSESKDSKAIALFVADSNMEAYRYYDSDAKISGPGGLKEGFDQVWLMRYVQPIFDPEDKVRVRVEDMGYAKQAEYDFNGVVVWKYTK